MIFHSLGYVLERSSSGRYDVNDHNEFPIHWRQSIHIVGLMKKVSANSSDLVTFRRPYSHFSVTEPGSCLAGQTAIRIARDRPGTQSPKPQPGLTVDAGG